MDWARLVTVSGQIGLATLAGGLIGVQRARRGKVAGVRTHVLICVGSTLFMQISERMSLAAVEGGARIFADPGRIASQVVVGVGFLGAGSIIRSGFSVAGLTSAATIWVVAALGLATGAGMYELTLTGLAASLLTLHLLAWAPVSGLGNYMDTRITFKDGQGLDRFRKRLDEERVEVRWRSIERQASGPVTVDVLLRMHKKRRRAFEEKLLDDPDVTHITTTLPT